MASYSEDSKNLESEDNSNISKAIETLIDLCVTIKKNFSRIDFVNVLYDSNDLEKSTLSDSSFDLINENIRNLNQESHQSLRIFEEYSNKVRSFISFTNRLNPFKNLGRQNDILARTEEITSRISSILSNTNNTLRNTTSIIETIGKLKKKELFIDIKKKVIGIKNTVITKVQAFWNKMILAFKTKKLLVAKKLLVGFAKILVPILAIVAAVKLIMRAARFLGRIFGRGGAAQEYQKPYIPSPGKVSYLGSQSYQMNLPKSIYATNSAVNNPINSAELEKALERAVEIGSERGTYNALNRVERIRQNHEKENANIPRPVKIVQDLTLDGNGSLMRMLRVSPNRGL